MGLKIESENWIYDLNLAGFISHDDDDLCSLGSSDFQGKVNRILGYPKFWKMVIML